jgi:hypothetical protein
MNKWTWFPPWVDGYKVKMSPVYVDVNLDVYMSIEVSIIVHESTGVDFTETTYTTDLNKDKSIVKYKALSGDTFTEEFYGQEYYDTELECIEDKINQCQTRINQSEIYYANAMKNIYLPITDDEKELREKMRKWIPYEFFSNDKGISNFLSYLKVLKHRLLLKELEI